MEPDHPQISIARQCELLGISRSVYYYQSPGESEENLLLMRLIDEQYTQTPFYGVPKMTTWLRRQGYQINHKRIERLMQKMGLQALIPRRSLSQPHPGHKKYPYLLKGLAVVRPNQVWCTDITYLRLAQGFVYLVAVMDWFSRYVLSWKISITLDVDFCIRALEEALASGKPEIFNSDQGSQFTSSDFTGCLQDAGIAISMDGRGRVFDNIFIERLWRSVKYEEVYLHDYQTVQDSKMGMQWYFPFYNFQRPHQSLDDRTPAEVHFDKPLNHFSAIKIAGHHLNIV